MVNVSAAFVKANKRFNITSYKLPSGDVNIFHEFFFSIFRSFYFSFISLTYPYAIHGTCLIGKMAQGKIIENDCSLR